MKNKNIIIRDLILPHIDKKIDIEYLTWTILQD